VTEFQPYDLEVIAEAMEASPGNGTSYSPNQFGEHFTISATGVVYICPGQQCEYMSLAEWMHQSLLYSVLTSMNFFKFYIHRKVFSRWRAHARYTVYCHQRNRLSQRLFLAKPMFVGPLVTFQSVMYEVESVKVMNIGTNVYHLQEFAETQKQVCNDPSNGAAVDFEQKHDTLVAILDRLVHTVNRSTEVSKQIDQRANARPKMKSMVQEKQEAKECARRYRIAKHDQSLLGDCIRLVDYMFQACLIRVVIYAAMEF
jgi:dynein heavy chain